MANRRSQLVRRLAFQNGHLSFTLRDGRKFLRDLHEFPVLEKAPAAARANFRILGNGLVVHWPDLDERIGASEVVRTSEDAIARAEGFDTRRRSARELILEGEQKQEIADDISRLIGRPPRPLGRGSKEYRALLVDIAQAIGLDGVDNATKPRLAKAIVERAQLPWRKEYESTGSTITRRGLQQIRAAVENLSKK